MFSKKMYALFVLATLLLLPSATMAQHCPFDGSSMIAVQLVNEEGETVKGFTDEIVLHEAYNETPEVCTYASELVIKPMLSVKQAFYNLRGEDKMKHAVSDRCSDCNFLGEGFFGATLSQATKSCMIKQDGSGFEFVPRIYQIWIKLNGETERIPVPSDRIYSLCTGSGSWSRIQPIQITVKTKKETKEVKEG